MTAATIRAIAREAQRRSRHKHMTRPNGLTAFKPIELPA